MKRKPVKAERFEVAGGKIDGEPALQLKIFTEDRLVTIVLYEDEARMFFDGFVEACQATFAVTTGTMQ